MLSPGQIVEISDVTAGAFGIGTTVTFTFVDTSLIQPLSLLQVAEYSVVIDGFTEIDAPVCPPLQVTVPVQEVADNIADVPLQMVALSTEMLGAPGLLFTTTVTFKLTGLVQPSADVQVAV